MTVVVAMLCDECRSAIIASDRFVGSPDGSIAVEGPDSKICGLGNHIMVAFSGAAPSDDLIDRMSKSVSDKRQVPEAAQSARIAFCDAITEQRKLEALKLHGVKEEDFYEFLRGPSDEAKDVKQINPDTQFLLIGADDRCAHVFHIDGWDKIPQDCNRPGFGFACIGAGKYLATTVFIKHPDIKKKPLSEALFWAFHAKQTANDYNALVSKTTDMWVVRKGDDAPMMVRPELVAKLRVIHDAMPRLTVPPDGVKTLEEIANDIVARKPISASTKE